MALNLNLCFKKCFCCSKNFNVTQLIELTSNSVIIGDETLDFVDIILDVCLIPVNHNSSQTF